MTDKERESAADKHLAWPEARIGYIQKWIDGNCVPGFTPDELYEQMFRWIAKADDNEAHF